MGDDHPRPGTWTLHDTFSLVLQRSGKLAPSATPVESAPRNWGQCVATAALPIVTQRNPKVSAVAHRRSELPARCRVAEINETETSGESDGMRQVLTNP